MGRPSKLFYWEARKGWFATIKGQRQRFGDTKAEAEPAFKAALTGAIQERRVAVPGSVASWVDEYLGFCKANQSAATYKFYRKILTPFCDFNGLGSRHISTLRLPHVRTFITAATAKPNRSASDPLPKGIKKGYKNLRPLIIALKACLNYLQDEAKVIHRDDMNLKQLKRPAPKARNKWVSQDEFDLIISLVDQTFGDCLTFMYYTGCRPFEMHRLQVRHIDLENSRVIIPNHEMPKKKVKENQDRIYYLPKAVAKMVAKRIKGKPDDAPVFTNTDGVAWKLHALNSRFFNLKKSGKVSKLYSPYQFRHGFATTKRIDSNMSDLDIAQQMGHSDLSMLKAYYDHSDKEIAYRQKMINI